MSGVEVATKISELVATNPPGSDPKSEGDNHLRLIKGVLQDVFDDSGTTLKTTLPIESPPGAILEDVTITGGLDIAGGLTVTGGATADKLTAAKIDNPVNLVDPADKIRATIAATETAGAGGLAITAFDDAATPDQKAQLLIGSSVLEYSPDDATKKFQLDLSRQTTGTTRILYVPAKPIDGTFSLWEPIAVVDFVSASTGVPVLDLGAFNDIRISWETRITASTSLGIQLSTNNGASWISGATDYAVGATYTLQLPSITTSGSIASISMMQLAAIDSLGWGGRGVLELTRFNKPLWTVGVGQACFSNAGQGLNIQNLGYASSQQVVCNAFRLMTGGAASLTGRMIVEGIR